jgi:integrase/recombinase XerC
VSTRTALVRGRDARGRLPAPLAIAAGRRHTAETLLRAWFEGKSPHTIAAYKHDLEDFALFLSRALGITPTLRVERALALLFKQSSPSAHEIVLAFRNHLHAGHLAASGITRHIATLRSVTKLGRMLGMMTWSIELGGVRGEKRRPTTGPTVAQIREMLDATAGDSEAETRNYAIVVTFFCLGLRVSELCGLNLEETDLRRGTTWIMGKGRREKELVPLPAPVVEAITRYLRHRGAHAGPLFQTRGNRGKHHNGRLETRSVLRIVRELGQRVGLHVWCHGLRHTSITQAAELGQRAGLGLDKVRAHSRHGNLATLTTYIDNHDRAGTQRTLAELVASTLTTKGGA